MKACEQTYMADMVYVVAFSLVPYCRGGQMTSERLVYTPQHYTVQHKVLQTGKSHQRQYWRSLTVCL